MHAISIKAFYNISNYNSLLGNYTDWELKKTLNQVPVDLLDQYLNDFVQLCYKCHSNKDSIHEVNHYQV